ncbi:MAG: type III pantothenate kinase [Candidatus Omnitrophota bacterium]
MLLAVDIGNTNINYALIDKKGKIRRPRRSDLRGQEIDEIIIVSVAPKTLRKVKRDLRRRFNKVRISVVGRDVKVPLKCVYNKRQIGQDRLITASAAASLYGLPILIIDFGTAVTFDVVSGKRVYLGGLILPGVKMSLESLSERTAMLPKTYLKKTRSFIGKDTSSSIRSGMLYGYGALCEGLIKLFRKRVGKSVKVVATGGDAPLIAKYAPSMKNVDLDLSLKGLYLLSRKKA